MTHKQTKRQLETLYLIEQFKRAHGVEEIDPWAAAEWAFEKGLWKRIPLNPVQILRREMTRAMRGEYILDPQNREVRKNHPVLDHQSGKVIWVDITKAKPEQMRISFSHHRNRILAECKQLSFDYDSYNENNPHGATLSPIDFNFAADIEESKLPKVYA
jgi:hypothetical protein